MERVAARVSKSGHGVPQADVVKRYEGSLESLKKFVGMADEVRIYDNSIEDVDPMLELQIENGKITYQAPEMPRWVKENVYYSQEAISELQTSRKEAVKAAQGLTGTEIITDAVPEKSYDGKILAVTDKYVVQQLEKLSRHGEPIIVLHRKEDLSVELSPDDIAAHKYYSLHSLPSGANTSMDKLVMSRQEAYAEARKNTVETLGPKGIVTKARNDREYTGKIIGFSGEYPNKVAVQQITENQAVIHNVRDIAQETSLQTTEKLVITSHEDSIDSVQELKQVEAERQRQGEIKEGFDR
jgi:predicted ABC-type ATPase